MLGSLTIVLRVIASFRRERPGVEVRIRLGRSSEQLEAIQSGTVDIGFMAFKRDVPRARNGGGRARRGVRRAARRAPLGTARDPGPA
jgi:DNA-binding transcriptional LysR family regulator